MNNYTYGRTCTYHVIYSIIWCVKYRRPVLDSDMAGRLVPILQAIASDKGFRILEISVEDMDHVRCLVEAPPTIALTQIVKYLKGISGRLLLKESPSLRESLWHGELWNNSYFAEAIGSRSVSEAEQYLMRQKRCQM